MSAEALTCRSFGHSMTLVPTPPTVAADYRRRGHRLVRLTCVRGCSYWRELLMDLYTGENLGARSGYRSPEDYLVREQGAGRLPRGAARVAFFAIADQ